MNNGRVFLDLSSVKDAKDDRIKLIDRNWRMIVDKRTMYAFSAFFPTKGGMVEPTFELFQKLKDKGMPVKIVRCDNGGEHLKLEVRCNSVDWKLSIKFEYT